MFPSTVRSFVLNGRATFRSWVEYKRQTGQLPWLPIAIHFVNWVVVLSGIVLLIWWRVREGLSKSQFAGVLLLIGIPYAFFWLWLSNIVKLNQIRNGRRLAKTKRLR
jgi:hypothetical protein